MGLACLQPGEFAQVLSHLGWEDFLEGLIRVSLLMALPTESELHQAGAQDAGEFLLSLRASSEVDYIKFVEANRRSVLQEPRQSSPRCLQQMLLLILRTAEGREGSSAHSIFQGEALIPPQQVRLFTSLKMHCSFLSKHLASKLEDGCGEGVDAKDLIAIIDSRRTFLLESLQRVEAFARLEESKLLLLCDCMSEASFEQGQEVIKQVPPPRAHTAPPHYDTTVTSPSPVIKQGDPGSTIYVILEGEFLVWVSQARCSPPIKPSPLRA